MEVTMNTLAPVSPTLAMFARAAVAPFPRPSTLNPQPTTPLVNVCMICHRVIGQDHRPSGIYINSGSIVSHGICLDCVPAYCAELGLNDAATARVLAAANRKP